LILFFSAAAISSWISFMAGASAAGSKLQA